MVLVLRIAAPILLGACVALAARPAAAQFFSPGPLARSHAALEGLNKCGSCHDQQKHNAPQLCLACHTELAPEIQQRTGLHGRLSAETRDRCASCHPDHRGRAFAMIDWGPGGCRTFDHRSAGWPLVGDHAITRCETCHDNRRRHAGHRPPARRQPEAHDLPGAAIAVRQLPLRRAPRPAGAGVRSAATATGRPPSRWPDSSITPASDFPLRGKHKPLACAACHPQVAAGTAPTGFLKPRADTFARYKPIAHGTCESCHRDPHQGAFGTNCADCHNENGWDVVNPSQQLGETFHDATRFPLKGLHRDVTCKSCHGPFGSRPVQYKGLAFRKCGDCHPDGHEGQLAARPGGAPADCGDCHSVSGFSPARFELEQHNKTRFPLTGAHRATACRVCHLVDAQLTQRVDPAVRTKLARQRRPQLIAQVIMRPQRTAGDCSGCHRDPHQGQFAAETRAGDDCAACHTTESFAQLRFDHTRDSRFPLTGAHSKAACAGCHKPEVICSGRQGGHSIQTDRDVLFGLSPG